MSFFKGVAFDQCLFLEGSLLNSSALLKQKRRQKSADFLHSKNQLITKSYLNVEVIDLFVKILVFVKILGQSRRKEGRNFNPQKCERHLKTFIFGAYQQMFSSSQGFIQYLMQKRQRVVERYALKKSLVVKLKQILF